MKAGRADGDEGKFFTYLHGIVNNVEIDYAGGMRNALIIIVDRLNDLPPWFYLGNENIRMLQVTKPDVFERKLLFEKLIADGRPGEELDKICTRFIDLTAGFSTNDFINIHKLYLKDRVSVHDIEKTITKYKYGDPEDRWQQDDMYDKVGALEESLKERVKGQAAALEKVVQIMKRTVVGFSGLMQSGYSNKPRGVMFFAGPTGVGKTEMIRALTEHMFGNQNKCIRFDMSEFGAEHADQRLFGAPPGYVGYDAGGELTNQVKLNPCSILLFDEIDKADFKIWDKFLQVLEDGRLTDSHGETVYFGQTIIAFTCNVGMRDAQETYSKALADGMADNEETKAKIRDIYKKAVEKYFERRREVLNRIGDNIVFFDFIDGKTREEIIETQLGRVQANIMLFKDGMKLGIDASFRAMLSEKAFGQVENGGRGVNNAIEKHLITPMAAALYDYKAQSGQKPSRCRAYVNAEGKPDFDFE